MDLRNNTKGQKAIFRPISEIMYSHQSVDVVLIQPPLLQRKLRHQQDRVVLDYWDTMGEHAALLGDLPMEPNHGLFSLAAALLQANYSVEVLDFHLLDRVLRDRSNRMIVESDIVHAIENKRARIFGISVKAISWKRALRIAELIKEYHPESVIVLGGIHATLCGKQLMESSPTVDIVALGDGERTIVDLLDCWDEPKRLHNVRGIMYRSNDGMIVTTPRIPINRVDLDALPYPAYELLCRESMPLIPRVLSARGCINHCGFCAVSAYYEDKINFRKPAKVVDEIEYLIEKFEVNFICLGDLTFMANRRLGLQICEEIIRRRLRINWWCQTTVGRLRAEDVELMKLAGCVQIGLGVESGSQTLLSMCNKPISIDHVETQCQIIKDQGVSVQTYWVLGIGGESFESAMSTIETLRYFIRNRLTDATHISIAVPYPGTPMWASPEDFGIRIVDRNFEDYWMNCDELGYGKPVMETQHLSADHIYVFWQLALAAATEEFTKRYSANIGGLVHFAPIQRVSPLELSESAMEVYHVADAI